MCLIFETVSGKLLLLRYKAIRPEILANFPATNGIRAYVLVGNDVWSFSILYLATDKAGKCFEIDGKFIKIDSNNNI